MCGINGIWNFIGAEVHKQSIIKMNAILKHRGPDENNQIINKNIGLGHTRLSIIDIHSGKQPMVNDDKNVYLIYNGEIYNYLSLKKQLQNKGYKFKTNSDTEVVLKCYEEYGLDCFKKFRGMFAVGIWDALNKKLVLARDRLGQKPLFYFHDINKIIFSSEIKSILVGLDQESVIDPDGLNHYLKFDYIPSPLSIYKNIKKLPPSSMLICTDNNISIKKYWNVEDYKYDSENFISYEEAKARTKELLFEAVKIRLMSDVPLGAFLSGGIDSSAIVAMMALQSPNAVNTFSIGLKGHSRSELKYARKISEYFETNHNEFEVELHDYNFLPNIINMFGEPFSDSAATLNYYVSKMSSSQITVALSGDGGDEVFAGYQWYDSIMKSNYFSYNKYNRIFSLINKIWPNNLRGKMKLDLLSRTQNTSRYGLIKNRFPAHIRSQLFTKDFLQYLNKPKTKNLISECLNSNIQNDFLSMMQMVDIKTYLADDINTKVDRMSMQNSLEVRSPFLDHKLVEYGLGIPPEYRIKDNIQKYILKDIFKSFLPMNIIQRKKQGFGLPSDMNMKYDLEKLYIFSKEILLDDFSKRRGLFNTDYIENLLKSHKIGRTDPTISFNQIWNLICLELWFQNNHNGFMI